MPSPSLFSPLLFLSDFCRIHLFLPFLHLAPDYGLTRTDPPLQSFNLILSNRSSQSIRPDTLQRSYTSRGPYPTSWGAPQIETGRFRTG